MGKKDRTRMPSGMAGLVRYDEELKESPKIKPQWVIAFSIFVVIIELLLRFLG
ncbi:MAG: preprotein translocase subunit Sec61beta [Candidatus Aenigmatarchaeota archaeon]